MVGGASSDAATVTVIHVVIVLCFLVLVLLLLLLLLLRLRALSEQVFGKQFPLSGMLSLIRPTSLDSPTSKDFVMSSIVLSWRSGLCT